MSTPARMSLAASLALALAGCAGAPVPLERPEADRGAARASPRELAAAGFRAWVVRNDPATAQRRFEAALQRGGGDPWARMGAALQARRRLDEVSEVAQLVALVGAAPEHPLAALAARRLGELAEVAPPLAQAVESGLAAAQPRLRGLAAARARAARALAAAALGQRQRAEALRLENGSVTAWTVAGPFGALHALEIDTPFAPEQGSLPETAPAPPGLPPVPSRAVPCPDGALALDGEPPGGDIHYLAADATVARGGEYLLSLGGTTTLRVFVDGAPVLERRAYAGFPPVTQVIPVALGPGRHHLLVKLGHGSARARVGATLLRVDGQPSDVGFSPTPPGTATPVIRPAPLPAPRQGVRELVAALEREVGPEAARWVAAREALEGDRETAKALLEEALALAPASNALLALRGELRHDDATLSERVARGRAETDLDRALAGDPGDAATRLQRTELAVTGERLDDAAALLDGLSEEDAARPPALVARARVARARGLAERAERLADEARRTGGDCAALELLLGLAVRRDALARQDDYVAALARCPGGAERVVDHRRRRGDLAGALAAAEEAVRAAPARLEARLARAALRAGSGRPLEAAADLEQLARLWPRDARVPKRCAEYLEAGGDAAGARAERERALLLDGGDLALRRALALEQGKEPLDELDEDGLRAVAAYRAARPRHATSSVTVLDFGAVEAHPGGAYTERVHTVVEARDQRAVDHVGEVSVPPGAELLVARTIKRDGRMLAPEEPLGDKRTLSLPGLEPGDFAEWAWIRTVPSRGAGVPGFSADPFYFRGDTPLWRSVYVARAPAALGMEADAHHLPAQTPRVQGSEAVLRIERHDVAPALPEPEAAADAEHLPFVQVGAGAGQQALAAAMGDALLESFRPSREVVALAGEIAAAVPADERGGEALPRAAYRRVNELVLGQGGSFGEPASAILSRGRGNRTVLLKSVLDALGVKARVALLREFGRDPAPYRFPRPDLYGYAVIRVEHGGRIHWLDPTTRGTPFGALPGAVRGAEGLLLPGPGEQVATVRAPDGEPEADRRATRLAIAVEADGSAVVEGSEEYRGVEAAALRASIERIDAQGRREAVEQALARSFRGAALTRLDLDGEGSVEGPLVLRWRARVARWARLEQGRAVVDAPLFPARLAARYVQRATRESPLLVGSEERAELQLVVTLPPGWSAAPAAATEVRGRFGEYQRRERAEPGRLVREDSYQLRRGRVPAGDYPAFGSFAAAIDAAQQEAMVFLRSDGLAAGAGR